MYDGLVRQSDASVRWAENAPITPVLRYGHDWVDAEPEFRVVEKKKFG